MKNYLVRWGIFTVITYLFFVIIQSSLPEDIQMRHHWWVVALFAIITFLFHIGLVKARKRNGAFFVKFYMGFSALKLMLLLLIIISYALINRASAGSFIAHFFTAYLFFTAFEVWQSYSMLRTKDPIK